jgi:cyclic pyranopterin phosphate synthase
VVSIKLIDRFSREITRLRVSITSKCNLNCFYCHREGYSKLGGRESLSVEQIDRLCSIISEYKIKAVKITGGEPLLHPKILEIVERFSAESTLNDLSLVTNGILLEKMARGLKKAGLQRLNIGLDSLCNSKVKILDNISGGIKTVKEAGFDLVKINMVLLKGINDQEIAEMMKFSRENNFILQIIELINTNEEFYQRYHVSLDEIEEDLIKRAEKVITRQYQDRKQYHLMDGTVVEIVRPVHNPDFCMNCHTLRVTHDFQFQPCLNRMDNIVPIGEDIEKALHEVMKRRVPFYVTEKCLNG